MRIMSTNFDKTFVRKHEHNVKLYVTNSEHQTHMTTIWHW